MQNVPEPKEEQSEKHRFFDAAIAKFIVRLSVGMFAFLISASLIGLLTLNLTIKSGEKVTIPNIVNTSVVDALGALSERNLELRKAGERNSPLIAENYVLSQDPIPGTVVKEGTPVLVVISLGSEVTIVPNLAGKPLREARVELGRAGLGVGRFSKMHHTSEKDVILAQSPLANLRANRETPVDMLVSLGPRPREYRLPDFVGHPMDQVNASLDTMGLVVGELTAKVDLSRPQGVILDQDPRAGSLIAEGSPISIVMATWHAGGKAAERKFATLLYRVPYGFRPKSVMVEVSDPEGVRTIYDEVDEPGAIIKLAFGYLAQCKVRVYLDNELEPERIYR
jgi:serine/threonine-protein kinase